MPVPKPAVAKPAVARPAAGRPAAKPAAAKPGGAPGEGRGLLRMFSGGKVSSKALMQFTVQLSTLVNAGLPLVRCLRILEGQLQPGPLKNVLLAVGDDVEGGSTLSEALAKYPQVFDRLYVNMVRAGEAGGMLGTILDRLASFSRKSEHIKAQVKSALSYPIVVLIVAGLVIVFVMVMVVPKFEAIFQSFHRDLPVLTQFLMNVSRSLSGLWYVWLAVPVALVVAFRAALRNERFAWRIDALKLRLPIAGTLIRKTIVARFTRTLGTLLQSGVPILEALAIVKAAISNRVLEDAVGSVHDSIREGETIAEPLGESGVFDDMVVNMIDVGEETGQLDVMLLRIADTYEDEVDTAVSTLFKAIEPILIFFMALVVGFIVLSLFLPILGIMESLQT